jgi:hypothetical protein
MTEKGVMKFNHVSFYLFYFISLLNYFVLFFFGNTK